MKNIEVNQIIEPILASDGAGVKLKRKGGVIAIDNVLWSGAVIQTDINDVDTVAIRELNDYLVNDERVALSMVPVGDGLTIAFVL